jgi:integrase/recombinase XerD
MINKLLEFFLEMMSAQRGAAKHTITSYEKDLRDFLKYLTPKEPQSATPEDLSAYLQTLKDFSSASIARKISALRQFYNFLQEENFITTNPSKTLSSPKRELSLPKFLSPAEITHLLAVAKEGQEADDIRLYAILELLYATGMRVGELVSLKLDVMNFQDNHPIINIKGKGNKERMVIMNSSAKEAVLAYLAIRNSFVNAHNCVWLFASQKSHLSRQRLGQMLKSLALKANIEPKKISPHIIRHTFASHLLANGADLRSIQRLLGHSSINTTQIYTHVQLKKLQEILDNFHPLSALTKNKNT